MLRCSDCGLVYEGPGVCPDCGTVLRASFVNGRVHTYEVGQRVDPSFLDDCCRDCEEEL